MTKLERARLLLKEHKEVLSHIRRWLMDGAIITARKPGKRILYRKGGKLGEGHWVGGLHIDMNQYKKRNFENVDSRISG